MYRSNADFVYTVTRAFVRTCQTPVLILPNDIPAHPYAVAMESAFLAPKAQVSLYPCKDPKDRIPQSRSPHPQLLAGASLHVSCRLGPAYRRVRCRAPAATR
jgi:hypothetical protein